MNRRYDVHGWDYSRKTLGRFLLRNQPEVPDLVEAFEIGGGKAFGLVLCDKLVEKADQPLRVPAWTSLRKDTDRRYVAQFIEGFPKVIARSSGPGEDWQDSRSGVEASEAYPPKRILEKIDAWIQAGQPKVLQEYAQGCGCVIDIGFSELLGRPVARVARGNHNLERPGSVYTSATWDHEAPSAVYDLESGEILVGSSLAFEPEAPDPFPKIVEQLRQGLGRLRIDFGVQLEIITDPAGKDAVSIVQIRPSPGNIRGLRSKPDISGELLMSTSSVNRAGDASGALLVSDGHDPFGSHEFARACADIGGRYGDLHARTTDLSGNIVLWDHSDLKHDGYPVEAIFGAALRGAVGQITKRSIFTNSAHDAYWPYDDHSHLLHTWQKCKDIGLQFGRLDSGALGDLKKLAQERAIRLRLVSDGLVGQIYLTK